MTTQPRVLITGVAGFIGSNLADRLLKENYPVLGIDNLSYGVKEQIPSGVEFHKLDIRSKDIYPIFNNIDFVFHLAAKNCISDCQADPVETSDVNITGTANVFEAARRAKVKKVIYAESSAMYEGIHTLPTSEREIAAHTFYAVSKVCGNLFAESYRRFFDLTSVGLRYFNVYGPRQDYRRTMPPVMSSFIIKFLRKEQPVIYGDGKKLRDFIHVDDINAFHLLCMKDDRVDNKVFNLGSGENYSVLEIYQIIRDLLRASGDPMFKPALPGEAEATLADISEAKKIGWKPNVDIKEGLRGLIDYIQREVKRGNIV
ncbi:NAD-dependent epimerase/dehydratase family protein [Candidatus Jorgensenbacteria bacterium]|nr:NAD-dependent epimerase/dehydratase family protein [Candidatus Jorgensenbacteria bacterium]